MWHLEPTSPQEYGPEHFRWSQTKQAWTRSRTNGQTILHRAMTNYILMAIVRSMVRAVPDAKHLVRVLAADGDQSSL
jgi:hypothetical protein